MIEGGWSWGKNSIFEDPIKDDPVRLHSWLTLMIGVTVSVCASITG